MLISIVLFMDTSQHHKPVASHSMLRLHCIRKPHKFGASLPRHCHVANNSAYEIEKIAWATDWKPRFYHGLTLQIDPRCGVSIPFAYPWYPMTSQRSARPRFHIFSFQARGSGLSWGYSHHPFRTMGFSTLNQPFLRYPHDYMETPI